MTIIEWQEKFLAAVENRQYNIYPPAMAKDLMKAVTDATAFKALAYAWFSRYENINISSTPVSQDYDPLTPRGLWALIGTIAGGTPPGPASITTEQDAPITTEDGKAIQAES